VSALTSGFADSWVVRRGSSSRCVAQKRQQTRHVLRSVISGEEEEEEERTRPAPGASGAHGDGWVPTPPVTSCSWRQAKLGHAWLAAQHRHLSLRLAPRGGCCDCCSVADGRGFVHAGGPGGWPEAGAAGNAHQPRRRDSCHCHMLGWRRSHGRRGRQPQFETPCRAAARQDGQHAGGAALRGRIKVACCRGSSERDHGSAGGRETGESIHLHYHVVSVG
jgi:hypothetical protein